jgi:hypothetical protein
MVKKPKPSKTRKRLETREGTRITTLALPRDLHRRVSQAGLELNWSFAEVTRAALEAWLAQTRLGTGGHR